MGFTGRGHRRKAEKGSRPEAAEGTRKDGRFAQSVRQKAYRGREKDVGAEKRRTALREASETIMVEASQATWCVPQVVSAAV